MDKIEDLKKLKALLDYGMITQVEFDILKSDIFKSNNLKNVNVIVENKEGSIAFGLEIDNLSSSTTIHESQEIIPDIYQKSTNQDSFQPAKKYSRWVVCFILMVIISIAGIIIGTKNHDQSANSTISTVVDSAIPNNLTQSSQPEKLEDNKIGIVDSFTAAKSSISKDIKNGLVAYYPCDGNANDLSGNSNNGYVYGAALANDRNGNSNSSYYFDGNSSFILVRSNNLLNITSNQNLSISFWMKEDGKEFNTDKYIISKYSGSTITGAAFAIGTGSEGNGYAWTQIASGSTNGFELRGHYRINDGLWHHLVYEWKNGEQSYLYIDSKKDVNSNASYGSIINSFDLYFGCGSNQKQFFRGYLDDIRIYNRILTGSEITYLATNQ